MAFNSAHFVVFFAVVLTLYFLVRWQWRWGLLFAASCYFYAAWRPEFLLLILGESALGYAGALAMDARPPRHRRYVLAGCVTLLVAVLMYFKYLNYFYAVAQRMLALVGIAWQAPWVDMPLPLGISFHTFIVIGYLIDVYRGKMAPVRHAGIFGVFSIYFPLLVAGPIERAPNLVPQFFREHEFDYERVAAGVRRMTWGLFKKVVIADSLAPFVTQVYAAPAQYDGSLLALATVLFAFQVYCDFSGYSDIAIGAAHTMGFRLMENFRQPYFALSIGDFWKRWHISLSTWLTDYVYSAFTKARWLRLKWYPKFLLSLMLTFLVSGLWHGANTTFLIWGALHGGYLVSSMLTQNLRRRLVATFGLERVPKVHSALRMSMTFALVCLTYIFFRAASVHDALYIVTHLFSPASQPGAAPDPVFVLGAVVGIGMILAADAWSAYGSPSVWLSSRPAWFRWPVYHGAALAIVLFWFREVETRFIYFQF